jgi:starvation-inducible DNA-binding protein
VPGLEQPAAAAVTVVLQDRLDTLLDLALTLQHVRWNVVGPHFTAVRGLLRPQVDAVATMADEIADRIATLGSSPAGLAAGIVARRGGRDYELGRHDALGHLRALDLVYTRVITGHLAAVTVAAVDPVTQPLLLAQTSRLQRFQYLLRAHAEDGDGTLTLADAGAPFDSGARP